MDFRTQLNSLINELPEDIRCNVVVKQYARTIANSYETLQMWVGPNAIQFDINWNHIIQMIAGIRHIHPDNITNYINNFQLYEYDYQNNNQDNYIVNDIVNDIDNSNNSESEEDSDDESEEDSDDESEEDSDDESEEGLPEGGNNEQETECDNQESGLDHTEIQWACCHCLTFTGSYNEVSNHEEHCPHQCEHINYEIP